VKLIVQHRRYVTAKRQTYARPVKKSLWQANAFCSWRTQFWDRFYCICNWSL